MRAAVIFVAVCLFSASAQAEPCYARGRRGPVRQCLRNVARKVVQKIVKCIIRHRLPDPPTPPGPPGP